MAQLEVRDQLLEATPGQIADGSVSDVISLKATEEIIFGVGVVRESEGAIKLPDLGADFLEGISVRSHSQANPNQEPDAFLNATGTPSYKEGDDAAVLRLGDVWVRVEEAVTPDDAVFMRFTAGVGEQKGAFRTDTDGGDAVAVTKARFLSSTTGAGIAKLRLLN